MRINEDRERTTGKKKKLFEEMGINRTQNSFREARILVIVPDNPGSTAGGVPTGNYSALYFE